MQSYVKFGLLYNIILTRAYRKITTKVLILMSLLGLWSLTLYSFTGVYIVYALVDPSRDFQHSYYLVTYEIQKIIPRPRYPHIISGKTFLGIISLFYICIAQGHDIIIVLSIRSPNLTSIYERTCIKISGSLYRIYPLL